MTREQNVELDPGLAEAVRVLRTDRASVVPQRLEAELVAAFRAQHVLGALRDDDTVVVPPQLESRLVAAFRQHQVPGSAADPSSRGLPWYLARAAVLVAAVGGAVWFGVTGLHPHGDRPRVGRVVSPVAQSSQSPAAPPAARRAPGRVSERPAAATVHGELARPLAGRALAAVTRAPAAAPVVGSGDDLAVTVEDAGFIPLSYGAPLPGEPAHVVRVELPRSALLDFGAQADDVPGEGAAVGAEVLLSEDGTARGIRFVDRRGAPAAASPPTRRVPGTNPRR